MLQSSNDCSIELEVGKQKLKTVYLQNHLMYMIKLGLVPLGMGAQCSQ